MNPQIEQTPTRAVTLITSDNQFVAKVRVLPYIPVPDALFWGSRFFLREQDDLYKEGFCAAALDNAVESAPQATGKG